MDKYVTTFGEQSPICIECERHEACFFYSTPKFTPMYKFRTTEAPHKECDILIVFENAGVLTSRRNYIQIFNQIYDHATGLSQYKINATYAVRCGNTPIENNKDKSIALCKNFLDEDIAYCNPKIVVIYGAPALKMVLNQSAITKKQGVVQTINGINYIPIVDPLAVLEDQRKFYDFVTAHKVIDAFLREKNLSFVDSRYKVINTLEEFKQLEHRVNQVGTIAFDTEYQPSDYLSPDFTCLGVSISTAPKTGWFIPYQHSESPWDKDELHYIHSTIQEWLRTKNLIMHNAEADVVVGETIFGVPVRDQKVIFCTMTGSMVINGIVASNTLKTLAHTYADTGGYEDEVHKWLLENQGWSKGSSITPRFGEIPLQMLGKPYACGDTDTTYQSFIPLANKVKETNQSKYYYKILLPSYKLNATMRKNGLFVDKEQLEIRAAFFQKERERIYNQITQYEGVSDYVDAVSGTGKKFSLKSPIQMRTLLFDILGLEPSSRMTKSKVPSLDAKAISEMALTQSHPILQDLLYAAKVNTYETHFVNSIFEKTWDDGRIHAWFHNFTESGRRGSTKPNVQNIPIGSGDPNDPFNIRMAFSARPGYLLIGGDYGQLEFRTAACYCEDENMITACNEDDPHGILQRKFGFERKLCKIINFLVLYEGQAPKLIVEVRDKAGVEWTLPEAQSTIDETLQLYSKLGPYIDSIHNFVQKHGYIRTFPTGQIRWMPHIYSPVSKIRERAKRESWNHINQSVGHSCLQYSLQGLQEYIDKHNKPWYINNDNHDGFLAEVPIEQSDEAIEISHKFMTERPKELLGDFLKVSLPVEMLRGTHWGSMEKIKM